METFSALLAICDGDPPVTDGFPQQRTVTRSFDAFLDLRLNKRLSKQSRRDLRRHLAHYDVIVMHARTHVMPYTYIANYKQTLERTFCNFMPYI